MDTVQVSAVKAAIQFCEDGNTIRKLNLRRAQKEIGIAGLIFKILFDKFCVLFEIV